MDRIDDVGDPVVYRPVSKLAVAAALTGLLSSLALISPMLWVLPLVGLGLAVAGLADVAKAGAEKAGRILALAGLALSIGFGMQAVTSSLVSRRITEGRAQSVVASWLDAIRANKLAAAQAMVSGDVSESHPGMMPHIGHDHDEDEHAFDSFLKVPAVTAIQKCGSAATWQIRCTGPDANATGVWGVIASLSPCEGGKSVEIAVQLTPTVIKEGRGRVERWLITKVDVIP